MSYIKNKILDHSYKYQTIFVKIKQYPMLKSISFFFKLILILFIFNVLSFRDQNKQKSKMKTHTIQKLQNNEKIVQI